MKQDKQAQQAQQAKQAKQSLLMVSVVVMAGIWGFIAVYHAGYIPAGLDAFIFSMIMIGGIYAFVMNIRRSKSIEEGFPAEDEMSIRIKYKAGYYAFMGSMYLWLLIFVFKAVFDVSGIRPSGVDAILGGGILAMAVLSVAVKIYLTRHYNEDQD